MSRLQWQDFADDKRHYAIAIADNGMQAVIIGNTEAFLFPVVFVNSGKLRKISEPLFVDRESAEEWCENEIAQWIPNPDA